MKLTFEHRGIPIALSVLVSIVFIVITTLKAVNFPAAADDFIFFVSQLHSKWLTISETKDVFAYFFAPAFGIHPMSASRLLGLLSYGVFGVINFKFLIIIGNVCYLFMSQKISHFISKTHQSAYLYPIILSLLLVPLAMNFRPVFITRIPFHILFAFLCFLFLTRKEIGLSFLFFVLTTFNVGSGVFTGLISFVALAVYSFRDKKYIPYALMYLVMSLALLKFLFLYRTVATESGINLGFDAIASYVVYVMVFIQKSVTPYFIDYKNLPVIYLFIGIAIFGTFIYLLIRKFRKTTDSPFFYLCGYTIMLGLLAAMVRSDSTEFFPRVATRYEHYSVIFVVSFVALVYGFISSRKIKIGIGLFFLILAFTRFYDNTISRTSGYYYDTFVTKNGERVRKLIAKKEYQYLHDFEYENIAQNASLKIEPKSSKRIEKHNVRAFKYRDEREFGIFLFTFKEKNDYKNIRIILQRGKKTYSFEPYQTQTNKYYCLIAKNQDLPKGKYQLMIWYEDKKGKYEYKLNPRNGMVFR